MQCCCSHCGIAPLHLGQPYHQTRTSAMDDSAWITFNDKGFFYVQWQNFFFFTILTLYNDNYGMVKVREFWLWQTNYGKAQLGVGELKRWVRERLWLWIIKTWTEVLWQSPPSKSDMLSQLQSPHPTVTIQITTKFYVLNWHWTLALDVNRDNL